MMTAAIASDSAPGAGARFAVIDIVRGLAILAMIVYHFAWDLAAHDLVTVDVVNEPAWKIFARTIASAFLVLVGLNLVLASRNGFRRGPYLRRLALIVAAAALVSLGTFWFVPWAFVFFGILHEIALASVLALPFLRAPPILTAAVAAFFIAGPEFLTSPLFDPPFWWWLGLSASPPTSVDYVPVFPWFGVVLAGVVLGRLLAGHLAAPVWAWRPSGWPGRTLVFAGRWSLPIYLVHQPVLLGVLFVIAPLIGPGDRVLETRYLNECDASCAADGYDRAACSGYCRCVLSGLQSEGDMLATAERGELTNDQRGIWLGYVDQCRASTLAPPAPGGT